LDTSSSGTPFCNRSTANEHLLDAIADLELASL